MTIESIKTPSPKQADSKRAKPRKPRPDFPLFPHLTGRWAKKVRGKLEYFGKVEGDPKGQKALARWLDVKDDLLAGRRPRPKDGDGLSVADLCNRFLTTKKSLLVAGELSPRTFDDAYRTCESVIEAFGKTRIVEHLTPSDFEKLRTRIAKRCGAVRLGNEVKRVRGIFKYAFEMDLIQVPIKFGPVFKVPKQRIVRLEKDAKGKKLFDASQIQKLIESATPVMAAMIYLGANAALGNADVGRLELRHLDLKTGWLNFPRPKTGVDRRCWLWPETIAAIKAAIEQRPAHKDDANAALVFVTAQGHSWHKDTPDSPVSKEFTKLLKAAGYHRPGLGFYTLRHVFATVAGDTLDQAAIDCVMGHAPPKDDMRARYRQEVSDERIKRVGKYVRAWLFGKKGGAR